ncbi:N-acetyltransferase [Alkalihalophilus pseudofirmus]|nr:N-acetyltransferase [Alkalihalophilus pseudofirmus]
MLIKYKSTYKKIAMGLLSYMPNQKQIKLLQETIEKYEHDNRWQLFLWKKEDIVGVIGIYEDVDGDFELCHVCVNPSFRDEGIGKQMLQAVQEKINGTLRPNQDTKEFYTACLLDV